MNNYQLQKIEEKNYPQLVELLKSSSLPFGDIGATNQYFYGLYENNSLIGSIGIEKYGTNGLFRSLAVKNDLQNKGLGKMLYAQIIDFCLHNGVQTLYLLTTTASGYFDKLGWKVIQRNEAPELILQSKEFSSICPSTAICMKLQVFNDNVDYANKIFALGFNCAQSVFVPFAVNMGMQAKEAFLLSTGFGAGMVYRGETCGAITGAMMAIGLKYGRSQAADGAAKDKTYLLINRLYDNFKKKHGTILCKELLKADISNPEELKRVGMAGAFKTLCPKFVNDAAILTNELLNLPS